MGFICDICGKKAELDAAHKHDFTRRDIIKSILDDYKLEEDKYLIPNLQHVVNKIKDKHKTNDVFLYLCKECHTKYDNSYEIKNSKENKLNGIVNVTDLKQVILTIFEKIPDKYYTPRMMYEIIQKKKHKLLR